MAPKDEEGSADNFVGTRNYFIISWVFRTINHQITAAVFFGVFYYGYKSIETLAGRETLVMTSLPLLKSNFGLPWVLSGLMIVWAFGERRF